MVIWMSLNSYNEKKLDELPRTEVDALIERAKNSQWRQKYHVQPIFGELGHPTVFIHHKHHYHVFYQWFPLGADKDIPYWYHVTSHDLSLFENKGIFIKPNSLYDDLGAFSGDALSFDDSLMVFYHGRWMRAGNRIESLLSGEMNEREKFDKDTTIVDIEMDNFELTKIKDPALFQHKQDLYFITGAMNAEEYGRLAVFKADDEYIRYKGELTTGFNEFGYQWEFPDIIDINGKTLLSFCPKGIDKYQNHYHNMFQAGYMIGEIDFDRLEMIHGPFFEFDNGFDFYAPRLTKSPKGKTILIGWMGMKNGEYPTDEDGWRHCLTIPRELTIVKNKLRQVPAQNLELMRGEPIEAEGYITQFPHKMRDFAGDNYEMIIDIEENTSSILYVKLRLSHREETVLKYDQETGEFTLDRGLSGRLPKDVDGAVRKVVLTEPLKQIRIFMDISSIELFLNDGEAVMSARIFPAHDATGVELSTETGECQTKITQYPLNAFQNAPIVNKR